MAIFYPIEREKQKLFFKLWNINEWYYSQIIPYNYRLFIWYLIFYYYMSFKDKIQKSINEKIFGVPVWYTIYNDDSENPW